MKEFNKCYLCNNKYIIINYTSSKNIIYEKEKRLDKVFDMGYYNCNLENIVLLVRSILGIQNENTFRVTIVYHDDITDLVYFSKGKIVKYAKRVNYKDSYFDMLYTTKKGLNIKATGRDSDLGEYASKEIVRMNNLELIEGISLSNNDLMLYEIYKLFYQKKPNYFENNDRIRTHIMMYILREYGIIESYDIEDDKVEDVPEEITENIEEDNTSDEKESDEEVTGGLEDIVNDVIDPYRIKEVIDYPKTLNLGLAKLKGESVRESVNKKLNPKPRESIFDDFAKDTSEETPKEEVKVEDTTDSEADIQNTLTLPKIEVETPKEEVKSNDNAPLMWELPKDDDVKKIEETPDVPAWDVKPDFNSSTNNIEKKEEEIPKVDIDNQMVSNNAFWIPVSDSKLETKDFPNINIPLNNSNFSNEKDNFGFPDIN